MATPSRPAVDAALLEIVVCPECRSGLRVEEGAEPIELACTGCGLVYPVTDGIPVLLVDDARRPA